MLKSLIILIVVALASVASTAQDSSGGDKDMMRLPGQFVKQGTSIDCLAEGGCIVMTPRELAATANAIYRKTLEMHTCGLESEI